MARRRNILYALPGVIAAIIVVAIANSCHSEDNLVSDFENSSVRQLLDKGNKYNSEGKTDSALVYYNLAGRKYSPSLSAESKMDCAHAYHNAALLYTFRNYDYAAAYSALLDALEITRECNDESLDGSIYLELGNIYLNYKDYPRMLDFYRKAFEAAVKTDNATVAIVTISTMMSYALGIDSLDSVRKEMTTFDSLDLGDADGGTAIRKQRKAIEDYMHGDTIGAIAALREAGATENPQFAFGRFSFFCDEQIVNILMRMKRYHEAIQLVRPLALSDSIPIDMKVGCYATLGDLYSKVGRPDSSLFFTQSERQLNDSLYMKQRYAIIRDIHETREVNNLDKKLILAESERRRTVSILWGVCGVAVLIFAFSALLYRKNRSLAQRNLDLFRLYNELMAAEGRRAQSDQEIKQSKTRLDKSVYDDVLSKVSTVLADEREICSEDFSLARLADKAEVNAHYVSEVINQEYGKNFSTLLGELRVAVVCRMLDDNSGFGQLTLEAVGAMAGFKSRSNFVAVFKKTTGLTPSQYRKIANGQQSVL